MNNTIVGVPEQRKINIIASGNRTMTLAWEGSVIGLSLDIENVDRLVHALRTMESRMKKRLDEMQDAEERNAEPRKTK